MIWMLNSKSYKKAVKMTIIIENNKNKTSKHFFRSQFIYNTFFSGLVLKNMFNYVYIK